MILVNDFLKVLLASLTCLSCTSFGEDITLSTSLFPEKFELVIYEYGKGKYNDEIDSRSLIYRNFKSWYLKNLSDWKEDLKTYVPDKQLLSQNLRVNITVNRNIVVVNYKDAKNKWNQASKEIKEDDTEFLMFLGLLK